MGIMTGPVLWAPPQSISGVVVDVADGEEILIPRVVRGYHRQDCDGRLQELRRMYANIKEFAEEYELAALIALLQ